MTLNLMLIFSKETINNERQFGQNSIELEGLIVIFPPEVIRSAKFHSNSFKALLFVFCLLLTFVFVCLTVP